MARPVTFQRIYPFASGLEHPADPSAVANVLRSMREAVASEAPFKVRFRLDDGSSVTVAPRSAA